MSFVRNFLSIVGAALGSSVLGGVFGSIVAVISPEFVKSLASPPERARSSGTPPGSAWSGGCFSERR
jgi:hypothetical protein